jgi:hypothetical protein
MISIYHLGGSHACGHVAFGVRKFHPLRDGDFPAANVVKLDGRPPQRGESVICAACGNCVGLWELSYAQPVRPRVYPVEGALWV